MSKQQLKAVLITCIVTFMVSIVVWKGFQVYQGAEDAAVNSCLLSIRSSLIKAINTNDEIRRTIRPSTSWKVLNSRERQLLIDKVESSADLDCGKYPYFLHGSTKDGENVEIFVKEVNGVVDVSLTGLGFDL